MDQINLICNKLHKTYNSTYIDSLDIESILFFIKVSELMKDSPYGNTTLLRLINNHRLNEKPIAGLLSGPMSLSKHTKDDKIVYIIGENHVGKRCDSSTVSINVSEYLKDLALTTDVFLDIYVEIARENETKKSYPQYADTTSFGEIVNNFRKCYNELSQDPVCKNSRIHYTDIRSTTSPLIKSSINMLNMISEVQEQSSWTYTYEEKKIMLQLCYNNIQFDINKFLDVFSNTEDKAQRIEAAFQLINSNDFFRKELSRSTEEGKIKNFIKQLIENTHDSFSTYLTMDYYKVFQRSFNSITKGGKLIIDPFIKKIFFYLNIFMMDGYLLARIFKRFNVPEGTFQPIEPHNIIIYAGDLHCENYREFFTADGFTQDFSITNPKTYLTVSNDDASSCLDISEVPQPFFS